MIEAQNLIRIPDVRHGFFTRRGGYSGGIYRSLNCGLGTDDDRKTVHRNHVHVATSLGLEPDALVTVHQVHGIDVITVDKPWPFDQRPKADAMVTNRRGFALGVLTADCVPILFADEENAVVGAAHAGWRGALAGIAGAVIEAMERLGARREQIAAAVGPCISQAAYEVGPEFRDQFLAEDSASGRFFSQAPDQERPHFDLPGFVVARLRREDIGSVELIARCTYGEEETFFSYRRATHLGEGDYGRQISAITLGPDAFMKEG